MTETSIFWFRRDLRLADHPALEKAAERGAVIGLFIRDNELESLSGAARLSFLRSTLADLNNSMGGALIVRTGKPLDVLRSVIAESGASAVFATDDYGPYGRRRDTAVGQALGCDGVEVHYLDSPYVVPPGSILTGGGTPYRVFTPFFRAWKAHGWPTPGGAVDVSWHTDLESESIGDPPAAGSTLSLSALPDAGEAAAWKRADAFLADGVFRYDENRNNPGVDGTSRLSPYLKFGSIHPRQLLDRLGDTHDEDVFRSELCWRDFYAEVLFQRPDSARHSYAAKMVDMEVDHGSLADERFEAWCQGLTGYPIVDAGMRQLLAEGWMHNRVRMIVGSFLVKDLHLDWTRGARHFMHHLVDGDLASNSHGWQWVAGTGTDASPYFRVFNPVGQSRKFDPTAQYVRRWVPEIAHMSDKDIHEPWTCKAGAPAGYPGPIVDHGAERLEALARLKRLKEQLG